MLRSIIALGLLLVLLWAMFHNPGGSGGDSAGHGNGKDKKPPRKI